MEAHGSIKLCWGESQPTTHSCRLEKMPPPPSAFGAGCRTGRCGDDLIFAGRRGRGDVSPIHPTRVRFYGSR